MIVVSDASPLIALAAVRHLDLLRQLYGEVLIPPAVHQEVTQGDRAAPGVNEVRSADWIRMPPLRDLVLVQALEVELDRGEAEAIVLALDSRADLLLIDERRGRAVATRLGVRVVGVLGVLVEAKRNGHLSAIQPVLDALAAMAGFHVSDELYVRVLEAAGE